MTRLQGKSVIVTGAAGGIGGAICRNFAREGAALVCVDIDSGGLERTAGSVRALGGQVITLAADVADEATARASVASAVGRFGRLDVLVSNAICDLPLGPLTAISLADWRRSMSVNLDSAFLLAKHAIPAMVDSGGGSIILVASELGRVAMPGRTWYCAQKAALVNLAKAIAVDHAHQGIRANSLSPGPTETPRFVRKFESLEKARASGETLFNRLADPDEIAAGAVFLASDESSFVTGTDLLIDGGRTAV
jgi:NAD(P)-dependent dehydrogenase (short-subunit alcohol dehydrogenase family)